VVLFHSPFCKIVQKAFARLAFSDFSRGKAIQLDGDLQKLKGLSLTGSGLKEKLADEEERVFAKATMAASQTLFEDKVAPYMELNRRLGNMYTASVYAQLVGLVAGR